MPNQVILIMTDTQRWDMLNCYRQTGMHTPQLDRLAGQGMRFDRAYTCQPVCGPARSALFTGLFPHSNGSWANCMPLGANVRHVGQRFSAAGIRAAYIGKWHLDGGDYFGLGRAPAGWESDHWYDMRNYLDELSEPERRFSRTLDFLEQPVDASFTFGRRVTDRSIRFLDHAQHNDFLLVVSYDEPHHPYLCPEPFASQYRNYCFPKSPNLWDRLDHKPEHQRTWAGDRLNEDKDALQIRQQAYFGCNSFVDDEIGRLISTMDALTPNALVVYTADHGDMLHSHSLFAKGPFMYDEITRIPLIMRWTGVIRPNVVYTQPVSHISLTPTLLAAAGLPLPEWRDGESLLPVLHNPTIAQPLPIFMEFGRYEVDHDSFCGFQPVRAAFDGRYKLVVNLLTSDELYDLESDPGELNNLIDSPASAADRDRLHDALIDWMNRTRDPLRGYHWHRRPWRQDAPPASFHHTERTRQRQDESEPRQLDYATGIEMTTATRKMH